MQEYLQWLRFVLNPSLPIPEIKDWQGLYTFVNQQAIAGVCEPTRFDNARPDIDTLMEWMGLVKQIRDLNELHNRQIATLVGKLSKAGFRCCILKGQGNAVMYPDSELRIPGDIDVWVDTDKQSLFEYVKRVFPEKEETFKHITFPVFSDTGVDMHYTPLKFYFPKYDRRLQQWINENKDVQMTHYIRLANTETDIAIPTSSFNAVYQLGHLMTHLFSWGIGFRQLIDYYYVLKELESASDAEKEQIRKTWKRLGMSRMASAIMWIEKEILGLPERFILTKPNKHYGKIFLNDVIEGGNFGKKSIGYNYRGRSLSRRLYSLRRLLRLFMFSPAEAFARIVSRTKGIIVKAFSNTK